MHTEVPSILDPDRVLRDCADYLVEIQAPAGYCEPHDGKHEEIGAYQVESAITLLQAYDILHDASYLDAARRLMNFVVEKQDDNGFVPMDPLPEQYYERAKKDVLEYTFEPLERDGQTYPGSTLAMSEYANFGLTDGLMSMAVSAYERADDDRYAAAGKLALDHYCSIWDPPRLKENHFVSFYGIAFALQAFARGTHARSDAMVDAITRLLTDGSCWWDYSPSKLAIVGGSLLTVHGAQFAKSHIIPGIDKLLAAGLEIMPGGFGMATDSGSWGDYADIRGTLPLAIIMKVCDAVAGTDYAGRDVHDRMLQWMVDNRRDAIADGRPFYEISYPDGRRFGSGTPSSILPVWWATGRFSS